ncbi:MAG: chlorophyll synthesis pathway protein BchC [Pseudomonadota bacterium]
METSAIILNGPRDLSVGMLGLADPGPTDLVVDVQWSGISTGTEKLFWSGEMPPFPGMGYPLVPGYEAAGEVMDAGSDTPFRPGDRVFVPGASCFDGARGLFGGAARRVVVGADRVARIDSHLREEGALLALAATARHAMAGINTSVPDLIIGHGVLGRLLARLTIAAGAPAPIVWETNAARRTGAIGYDVIDPAEDPRRDYLAIYDASGAPDMLNTGIAHIEKGGEVVLAGFYAAPLSFAFPPAFMKEARIRVAAEWTPDDLIATRALIESGALSLANLVTHVSPPSQATQAYEQAFTDPDCLKMILDWKAAA